MKLIVAVTDEKYTLAFHVVVPCRHSLSIFQVLYYIMGWFKGKNHNNNKNQNAAQQSNIIKDHDPETAQKN